jgi:sugar/nucleoside kinase (ribokinase family)
MSDAPQYLLIGHITADLTPEGRRLGGTVSYATRTVSSFGLRIGVLTSAAHQEPLVDELDSYAEEIVVLPATSTSTFENIYGPNGRTQYIRGVAAPIGPDDVPTAWLSSPLVHLAPLTGEVDPQIAYRFPDATVMLTLQGWLRRWDEDGRVRFKPWHDPAVLEAIDIVVFSEEDIVEAPELEQEFAQTVEHLFVTRAEKGGTYYHKGEPIPFDTPQVQVVNPTGAGDVFAAALLSSLYVLNGNMQRAISTAASLGATSVTRYWLDGSPTPAEVQAALASVGHTAKS